MTFETRAPRAFAPSLVFLAAAALFASGCGTEGSSSPVPSDDSGSDGAANDTDDAGDGEIAQQSGDLTVDVPADMLAYGEPGGPFNAVPTPFELHNTGDDSLDWRAVSATEWVHLAQEAGTLLPDEIEGFAIGIDADAAALLAAGQYEAEVVVRDVSAETPTATIRVHLVVGDAPGLLAVMDLDDYSAEGPEGGPFAPAPMTFLVSNQGAAQLDWSVAPGDAWLSATTAGGVLRPGERVSVALRVDSDAASQLDAGAYMTTVSVRDETLGTLAGVADATLSVQPAN